MAGAGFEFSTNIGSVAGAIEQGMKRINQAMRQAQTTVGLGSGAGAGGPTAALEQQLIAGVQQRLNNVGASVDRGMERAFSAMESDIRSGKPVNVPARLKHVVQQTEHQLRAIAEDVGRGLPAPMKGLAPQLQTQLRQGASEILRETERMYGNIAQHMRRLADQTGTRGVRAVGAQLTAQGRLSGVIAGGEAPWMKRFAGAVDLQRYLDQPATQAQQLHGLTGLLGPQGYGLGKRDVAKTHEALSEREAQQREWQLQEERRNAEAVLAEQQKRVAAERQATEETRRQADEIKRARLRSVRVLREIQRNMDVHGQPRDVAGARVDARSGLIYDKRGNAFRMDERGLLTPHETTMVQTGTPGQVPGLRPRDLETFRFDEGLNEVIDLQRRNALVNKSLQERLHIERMKVVQQDKARADIEARAASQRIARELRAGTATQLPRNVVRDSRGAFYQVGPAGAVPLDPGGAHIQRVLTDNERLLEQQRQRESNLARRRAAAESAAAGGGGGGPRRPGMQGIFDRAFGPGGGSGMGQRGFRFDDILTSGMSFGRYVISAGAFAGIFKLMSTIRESTVDYKDSITDLNVAMGQSGEASRGFLNMLGETSRLLGENPARALDAAARGIRAFGAGVTDLAGREAIGDDFASAVAGLGVIADKPLDNATGDIIAIANNFDIATDRLWRINDAIASAKQTIGGAPAEIAQGLSSVGSAAEAAGFSLEETANMISLVQARTDQSGRAVATRLGRIFSIMGGSGGRTAITNLNRQLAPEERIDVNATLAVQLRQLGAVYNDLTTSQQQQLRSALGGTANTRELIPLLKEQELLTSALAESYASSGQGMDEFLRKSRDLRGIVTKISGDIQHLIVQLTNAGAFDLFVQGVRVIEPFLNAIVQVLQVYNALPGPMKSVLALTLQLAAAQKLYTMYLAARLKGAGVEVGGAAGIGVMEGRRLARERRRLIRMNEGVRFDSPDDSGIYRGAVYGPLQPRQSGFQRRAAAGNVPVPVWFGQRRDRIAESGRFPRTRGFVGAVRADMVTQQATRELRNLATGSAVTATRLTMVTRALQNVARASLPASMSLSRAIVGLRGFVNSIDPLTLSIVGVMAVVSAWNAANRTVAHTGTMQDLTGQIPVPGDLRGEIQAREQLVEEWSQEGRGIFGGLTDFLQGGAGQRAADALQAEADRLRVAADGIDAGRSEARRSRDISMAAAAIDVTTEGGIQSGLQTLQEGGRNATVQINALREAIRFLGQSATTTATQLSHGQQIEFRQLAAANIASSFAEWAELESNMPGQQRFGWGGSLFPTPVWRSRGQRGDMALFEDLAAATGARSEEINSLVSEYLQGTGGELDRSQQEELSRLVLRELENEVDIGEEGSERRTQISRYIEEAIRNTVTSLSQIENIGAQWDEYLRLSLQAASAEADRQALLARKTGRGSASVVQARTKLEELIKQRQEALNADEDKRPDAEQLEQINDQILAAEFEVADALSQELDSLLRLAQSRLASTDQLGRLSLQLDTLRRQLALAGQDVEKRRQIEAQINDVQAEIAQAEVQQINAQHRASVDSRDEVGRAHAEAWAAVRTLRQIIASGDRTSQAYWDAVGSYNEALVTYQQAQVARINAFAQSRLDPRDALGRAVETARGLRRQLGAALPGSTEYANLVTQIREAELNVLRERVATANARQQAGVDPQSGLQNARVNLDIARRELGLTRRGTTAYYDALRGVNEAMIALADAQNEAMSIRRQLAIDLTDPVATAREALRSIRDQIRSARSRGAPSDVINELRVEEKNQEAQVEAALFQQRLSDVQVAEQLGRISHAAYIRYLEGESARLRSISDRTRQQQEQLNQIDLLLKQAMEQMAGQFNIGDIRLPTPYEVRRAIEAEAQGLTLAESFRETQAISASRVTNDYRQANIQVYGANIEEVEALLREYFGPSTVSRSSTGVVEGGRI